MFQINDDLSLYVTRGDVAAFYVSAVEGGESYTFKAGDVLRMKVFEKKSCENVVMQKDFPVETDAENVEIYLTENDTRIGSIISKPKDYWYEVELNPLNNPQTIIGYDEDGAKVFKLFPEGKDAEVIEEEDVPLIKEIQGSIEKNAEDIATHKSNFDNPHKVTARQIGAARVDSVVKIDEVQKLTEEQKAQARANIGATSLSEVLNNLPTYTGEVEEV